MQARSEVTQARLTKLDWIKHCTDWEQSGETQKLFCAKRNIAYGTFVHWRMQIKKPQAISKPIPFSEVAIKPAVPSAFKINLPNGISLTIPSTIEKATLKMLFDWLGLTAC